MDCFYECSGDKTLEQQRFDIGICYNYAFKPHWHREFELMYVIDGQVYMHIDDESRLLKKNCIAICCSDQIHHAHTVGTDFTTLLSIFAPALVNEKLQGALFSVPFLDEKMAETVGMPLSVFEEICHCFQMMAREVTNMPERSLEFARHYLSIISELLLRHVPKKKHPADAYGGSTLQIMQEIIAYINENYQNEITLDMLSSTFYISRFYLSRLFQRYTTLSFKNYLSRVRITQAKRLINTSVKSITDISRQCGFNSIRTFNRVFKEQTGQTPTEYQRQLRGE